MKNTTLQEDQSSYTMEEKMEFSGEYRRPCSIQTIISTNFSKNFTAWGFCGNIGM